MNEGRGETRKVVLGPGDAADRLVAQDEAPDETTIGATLRPRSFDEYVGQTAVVDNLKIAIDAALAADAAFGPPSVEPMPANNLLVLFRRLG